jgi:hypothetical protein
MKKQVCVTLDEETIQMLEEVSDFYGIETRDDKVNISATIRDTTRRVWNGVQKEKEEILRN